MLPFAYCALCFAGQALHPVLCMLHVWCYFVQAAAAICLAVNTIRTYDVVRSDMCVLQLHTSTLGMITAAHGMLCMLCFVFPDLRAV